MAFLSTTLSKSLQYYDVKSGPPYFATSIGSFEYNEYGIFENV